MSLKLHDSEASPVYDKGKGQNKCILLKKEIQTSTQLYCDTLTSVSMGFKDVFGFTSARRNLKEPKAQQPANIQQHYRYEDHPAQDVVITEEDEGLHKTKAGRQAVLQSKVLFLDCRAAR